MSGLNHKSSRRRFGLICIAVALLMLLAGESVLKSFLATHQLVFVCYWLVCLGLTLLAAGIAIIDAAQVRLETREEQRTLLEKTLQQIEAEKREKDQSRK